MTEEVEEKEEQGELYAGGNELFFSFVLSLMEGVDREHISLESLRTIAKDWGASWSKAAELTGNLERDLDKVADALAALGLVRVFAPARGSGEQAYKVLVLRCNLGRYVGAARVQAGLPRHCLLAPIVEGALAAAGVECRVSEDRRGMLRTDECTLTVDTGEGK